MEVSGLVWENFCRVALSRVCFWRFFFPDCRTLTATISIRVVYSHTFPAQSELVL